MPSARERLSALARRTALWALGRPQVGEVRMGDFARTSPVSDDFGYDRGTPIDRFYIERFLAAHSRDICGRVLEVGERTYSRRFGSGITKQDVLHVRDVPEATLVGDLAEAGTLPEAAFDCIILTQTLHLIYDIEAAVRELERALRPGGVALVTMPGVSSIHRGEWGETWYWSLTERSAERLFRDAFRGGDLEVETHGNVFAATCFLHGLAVEEVEREWLERRDPLYPVTVTVRAVRRSG